jgi:two-component system, LytTR family, sensor kinase
MNAPLHKVMRHPWLASFAFWQVSALIFILHRFSTTVVDQAPVNWPAYIASMEALHISWGMLTVPVFQWLQKNNIQNVGKWILVSGVVACIHSIINTLLFSLAIVVIPSHLGFREDEIYFRIIRFLVASPVISWIVAVLILLAWYGWTFFVQYEEQRTRAAQLQNELIGSQLQMLRMQLNPHFLFNAFNTISMMMRTGRIQEATTTLSRIAELFRTSLLKSEHQQILLSEEINFCKQYLEIEAIRFSDRLKIIFNLDPATEQCSVPSMILQPLIENAFKHGLMNQLDEHPELEINTRLEEEKRLILEVRNTGRLKTEYNKEGIGLNNVRKRLLLSYRDAARFDLQPVGNVVVARIEIVI